MSRLEIWEPTLRHLIARSTEDDAKYAIDEIWSWEAATHGDSFLLNKGNLGGLCMW